jgi:hypothetical protein
MCDTIKWHNHPQRWRFVARKTCPTNPTTNNSNFGKKTWSETTHQIHLDTWRFPGVTPKSFIFSIINHPAIGVPPFMETLTSHPWALHFHIFPLWLKKIQFQIFIYNILYYIYISTYVQPLLIDSPWLRAWTASMRRQRSLRYASTETTKASRRCQSRKRGIQATTVQDRTTTNTCMYIYIYIQVYTYIYIQVCMYIYILVYTHAHV